MKILGLNLGHDSSSALFINGEIIAACEEERYSKLKHTRAFPIKAINDCLKIGNLKVNDIDIISVGFLPNKHLNEFYLKPAIDDPKKFEFIFQGIDRIKNLINLEQIIKDKLGYKNKIEFNNHHYCHLASTFYPSGFKKSLVVSYDGLGEYETGLIGIGTNNNIKIIHNKNVFPDSLGLIYSAITNFLGWKAFYDEGIIMGLAPYGNPHLKIPNYNKSYIQIFREIIKYKSGLNYKINLDWITYNYERDTWLSKKFTKIFGKKRNYNSKINTNHKNIAAALQLRIEEVVIQQLKYLKSKYKIDKLCIAGGVGLNCSLNGKIQSSKIFKEIFIQPASGDSGLSYGAGLVTLMKLKKKYKHLKRRSFYLGSRFSNKEIKKVLLKFKNKINYTLEKNISKKSSEIIANGNILGWFQGAAEFGPRALGNRSILCKPFPAKMRDHMNKNVKFRENFRPFAPAVLNNFAKEFFELEQESQHMLIATKVKDEKKKYIPATVHIDKSCRVQTVHKKTNKKFFDLINNFYQISKVPVVLNTSFNVKGQPIVNDPEDAILCFLKYNIDYLAIGDFIVTKSKKKKKR
jgi:carbamoyltransferase